MHKLKLDNIQKWIGAELVNKINKTRIKRGEVVRQRKLGTTEIL